MSLTKQKTKTFKRLVSTQVLLTPFEKQWLRNAAESDNREVSPFMALKIRKMLADEYPSFKPEEKKEPV